MLPEPTERRRKKLSRRVYLAGVGVMPYPDEVHPWLVVFKTGWTLEQVNALSEKDYQDFFSIRDGMMKSKRW